MIMILHMYEVTTELILVAPVNSYDYLVLLDAMMYMNMTMIKVIKPIN